MHYRRKRRSHSVAKGKSHGQKQLPIWVSGTRARVVTVMDEEIPETRLLLKVNSINQSG
jgi:hypothetical protein